jgi:DNA-directed RNA polymerase specialized sigma24 family protein
MNLDRYFEKRYTYLKSVANNVVRSRKRTSQHPTDDAHDLLHWCIERAYKDAEKYAEKTQSDIDGILTMMIKNQWNWSSNGLEQFRNIHSIIDKMDMDHIENTMVLEEFENVDELVYENIPTKIKEYILDLKDRGFSNNQIQMILAVNVAKRVLDLGEITMFRLYFVEGMSIRDICKEKNVSQRYVSGTLNAMKNKIKEECRRLLN